MINFLYHTFKVIFADFVRVAQEMCSFKLEDSNSQTKLLEALTQRTTIGLSKMPPTSTIPSQERVSNIAMELI